MADKSTIEWTDSTWNPVRGCTKISAGCKNCYAETFAERFRGVKGHPYEQGFDLRLVPEKLAEPLSWKKPRRVFVNSMSDLFQEDVPDTFIDQCFIVMSQARRHTFQVLTKRAQRMHDYITAVSARCREEHDAGGFDWAAAGALASQSMTARGLTFSPWPLPNVWLGVSVENQHFADERIPLLLQTPAAVRFISAEPLLEAIDIRNHLEGDEEHGTPLSDPSARTVGGSIGWRPPLDWVIVGGESGHGARPLDVAWARSIVQQCKAAQVPVFLKQLGANVFDRNAPIRVHLRSHKGGDPLEWPEDLRIREFPNWLMEPR